MKWEVGVPLIFDDTYEHSVWNNTNQDRVILLFDLWFDILHQLFLTTLIELFINI